jgi:hypothetical protein
MKMIGKSGKPPGHRMLLASVPAKNGGAVQTGRSHRSYPNYGADITEGVEGAI